MNILMVLISAACTIFNIYMWYNELVKLKIFQLFIDIGGTLLIIIIFVGAGNTVTGFEISMIVSALWSIFAEIENHKRNRKRQKKLQEKILRKKQKEMGYGN